jgi:hypothetical protein
MYDMEESRDEIQYMMIERKSSSVSNEMFLTTHIFKTDNEVTQPRVLELYRSMYIQVRSVNQYCCRRCKSKSAATCISSWTMVPGGKISYRHPTVVDERNNSCAIDATSNSEPSRQTKIWLAPHKVSRAQKN